MGAIAANAAVAIAFLLTGLSLLLGLVALLAYRRIGHGRLLGIGVAFLGFAAMGVWFAQDFWHRRGELAATWDVLPWLALGDLGIVLLLYLAVLKD